MNLQERKELVDLLSKKANVINQKAILLLAVTGGVGAYTVKFLFESENRAVGYLFAIVFLLSSIGLFINYTKLHKIEMKMEEFENV
ncbi:hypothetical protein [Sulfuricurvum sp.]|uniref:hypothetical protein n=1 Tax=Sulfuricurvum sp. TaxID=2025608 RepID=UPI003C623641